jgi:hypothetical protein
MEFSEATVLNPDTRLFACRALAQMIGNVAIGGYSRLHAAGEAKMTLIAHWVKTLLLAILVCARLSTASAADSGPPLAFSDTYPNGIPKEYRTKGDVSGSNGLHLKDQSAVFREVDGHGEIVLDFSIDATAVTKGDPKFRAQIKISDTTVNVQLVQSSTGNRLLLFGYADGRPPENYREFPIDGPINGLWQVRLLYGLLLVTKEGALVGQDGISTVDSKFYRRDACVDPRGLLGSRICRPSAARCVFQSEGRTRSRRG